METHGNAVYVAHFLVFSHVLFLVNTAPHTSPVDSVIPHPLCNRSNTESFYRGVKAASV